MQRIIFFFFKQKTAYEMRISDWSSDVCSSGLKAPVDDATVFPTSPGVAPDVATLLGWIGSQVPARLPVALSLVVASVAASVMPRTVRAYATRPSFGASAMVEPEGVELAYETVDWQPVEGRSEEPTSELQSLMR